MHRIYHLGPSKVPYREIGSGSETIYLVHGYGGHPNHWEHVAEGLKSTYRVVIPSFTAVFNSREYQLEFDDLVHLLQRFILDTRRGQERVHLVGASFGGTLCWAVSSELSDMPASLILLSPMPPFPHRRIRSFWLKVMVALAVWPPLLYTWLMTPWGQRGLPRIEDLFLGSEHRLKRRRAFTWNHPRRLGLVVHLLRNFTRLLGRIRWSFWEPRLMKVAVPVCLVWGRWDRLYETDVPWELESRLKNCRFAHVERAGHLAMKENPDAVLAEIHEFLSNTLQKIS